MITIGYSTRKHNPEYQQYLQNTCMYKEVQIIEKINNGDKSLSQVYNEILSESNYDIVVLCHDDLEFDTNKWGEKLLKSFEKNPDYGILGLAGTKYLDISGQWWKIPQTMYGIVNHKHEGKKWTSTYSSNMIGITLLAIGTIAFLPFKCEYRLSLGLMQMAVSPSIVSGRVVAMVTKSLLPSIWYFKWYSLPCLSS